MSPTKVSRSTKSKSLRAGIPRLIKKPKQRMAVITSVGDPNTSQEGAVSALYRAVYQHKFSLKRAGKADFKVGSLVARWPDAHLVPKSKWTGVWALPVPSGTRKLLAEPSNHEVVLETWDYGAKVAEILHLGSYAEEGPSVEKLHTFIETNGYQIAGVHEEEYLTRPDAKVVRTIIRYPVVKRRETG
jgi:hypothetical protein